MGGGPPLWERYCRQEGVEQRIAHADGRPAEPHDGRGHAEPLAAAEQGRSRSRDGPGQPAPHDGGGRQAARAAARRGRRVVGDGVQDVGRQPRLGAVAVGDAVHDGDGLGLAAAGEQVLRRLEEAEGEEAHDGHGEGDEAEERTKRRHPSSAGQRAMKNQASSDDTSWPTGHQTESRVSSDEDASGRNSREEGAVDGQVAADAKPEGAVQEADGGPGWRARRQHAEEAGRDQQRGVERDAAAHDVGADAPEEAAEARGRRIASWSCTGPSFPRPRTRQTGREGKRDTLCSC